MPKNSLTDLHEIFVKSQRLTAHQTDAGSTARHLNRGVSELGEASRSLASRADTLALGGLAEDPHSRKIFNEVNSITLTTAQDSVSLEGTDLEGYLAHHHDMILLTAIEESRQINENYLYEIQQRSVLQEWENAKTQFMESLGHRAHKWTPAAALSMTNTSAANITYEGGDHQSLLEFNPSQTPFLARSVASSSATPAKRNPLTSTANDSSDRPVLPKIVASHADCVRKISTHQSQAISSRHENIHPCKLLLSSLKEVSAVNANTTQNVLSTKDLIGYRSLLSLIASMTGEDRYGSDVIPGYFSTITADPSTVDLILLKEKKNRLTKGAKLFFEDQMMIAWDHKIEEAIQLHEIDLSSRHAGKTVQMKLQKLIQYEYRNHMIPKQCKLIDITINSVGGGSGVINTGPVPSILKNVPIWALVYYYLRSGNLDLAVQELQEAYLTYHYEDMFSVLCVLKAFIGETNDFRELRSPRATPGGAFSTPRHGSGGSGTPTALSANDAEVVESAIKQCKLHYQRESMKEESQIDPYYLFLLNLVALIDYRDLNGSLIPNFSFEDFLWAHLWFITTSRQLHDLLATSSSSSATSANMIGTHSPFHRKPAAVAVETTSEENELLELVYAYGGATYFDHDGQSPFKYALLLCCCHRFGDALTYLWMSGKTFPAAHLLMICLYYGFVLPHVPLLHNPNHPLVNSDYHHYHHHHTTTASATVASLVSNVFHLTPGHIITMFVTNQLFQQYYPDYCLDYYLLLQTKWMESIHYNNEELLKLQIIKFDELIIEKLTQFLISLTPSQLKIILGIPTLDINNGDATDTSSATSLNGIVTKLLGREYRSRGYLDHYLKGEKIVVLCNKVIYYYLAVDKDLVRVIDYYQLLGGYNDILSLVGQELIRYWVLDTSTIVAASNTSTNTSDGEGNIYNVDVSDDVTATASSSSTSWSPVLLQKRRLRDFWRGRAEQLMKSLLSLSKHLEQQPQSSGRNANTNILHLLNLSNEMFNNFHLIMILYQLIDDVYRIQDYSKALLLLDMNQLFPSVQENVGGGMEGMSFFLNPVLKHVVDDLLIVIIHALYEFMKKYQAVALSASHGRGGARSAWSLGAGNTDDINAIAKEYVNMERRYQVLSEFLVKYKDQLTKKQIILQEYQKLQSYMIVH